MLTIVQSDDFKTEIQTPFCKTKSSIQLKGFPTFYEDGEYVMPINLWMNIPVDNKGDCQWKPPKSTAGDYVCLRSTMDCIVVMSACPQDLVPINAGKPVAVHFEIIKH